MVNISKATCLRALAVEQDAGDSSSQETESSHGEMIAPVEDSEEQHLDNAPATGQLHIPFFGPCPSLDACTRRCALKRVCNDTQSPARFSTGPPYEFKSLSADWPAVARLGTGDNDKGPVAQKATKRMVQCSQSYHQDDPCAESFHRRGSTKP